MISESELSHGSKSVSNTIRVTGSCHVFIKLFRDHDLRYPEANGIPEVREPVQPLIPFACGGQGGS